jgi:membrane protein YdbS with pleckstrin-like domain
MSLDVEAAKKRLMIMALVNAVAVLAAAAALYGYFVLHIGWGLAAFAVLLAVGVAAQIWFIASLRRANKGAE